MLCANAYKHWNPVLSLTCWTWQLEAKQFHSLLFRRKIHCGPDPSLVTACVLLQLCAWHDCSTTSQSQLAGENDVRLTLHKPLSSTLGINSNPEQFRQAIPMWFALILRVFSSRINNLTR